MGPLHDTFLQFSDQSRLPHFLTLLPCLEECRQSAFPDELCSTVTPMLRLPLFLRFNSVWQIKHALKIQFNCIYYPLIVYTELMPLPLHHIHFLSRRIQFDLVSKCFLSFRIYYITTCWWNVYHFNKWATAFALIPFEELVKSSFWSVFLVSIF